VIADSDELEALFFSIAQAHFEPTATAPASAATQGVWNIHSSIRHLTGALHDALYETGYHQTIEQAMGKMPDAHNPLRYILTRTREGAIKLQEDMEALLSTPIMETNAKAVCLRT
jgi:chemotaxis regulatin CheY-phosphate phosphatase CheZ